MKTILEGAAFQGQSVNEQQARKLITLAEALLDEVSACANDIQECTQ